MSLHGRHKTVDKALKKSISYLESISSVKKIVLGFSECCRHKYAPGVIRYKSDVSGGIKVNAYSGKGVTDIFIRIDPISDREHIKAKIADKFG